MPSLPLPTKTAKLFLPGFLNLPRPEPCPFTGGQRASRSMRMWTRHTSPCVLPIRQTPYTSKRYEQPFVTVAVSKRSRQFPRIRFNPCGNRKKQQVYLSQRDET